MSVMPPPPLRNLVQSGVTQDIIAPGVRRVINPRLYDANGTVRVESVALGEGFLLLSMNDDGTFDVQNIGTTSQYCSYVAASYQNTDMTPQLEPLRSGSTASPRTPVSVGAPGDMSGPAGSELYGLPIFADTTGKLVEDATIRLYPPVGVDPTVPTPGDGDIYWNTTDKQWMVFDGSLSRWRPFSESIITPSIVTPADGATLVSPRPTFFGSAFLSDFAGVSIATIQLQITTDPTWAAPLTVNKTVSDAASLAALSITFGVGDTTGTDSDGFLNNSTLYYCRIRYQDSLGNWSLYSPDAYSLTTGAFPSRFATPPGVSGNWNDGGTWGNTSPGVEGLDYPPTWGGTEVYVNKNSVVTVPASYTATVKSLWVGIVNDGASNSGLVVDTDATLNMETGTTEYIPADHTTEASLSSDIAIGVSAFTLSLAYSVGNVLVLDCDDLRYMESVKVATVTPSGPNFDYTIETSGAKPSGGTWGITVYPHTAASTKVREANGTPSPYVTYGFFAAGEPTNITFNAGTSWNFNGIQAHTVYWGAGNEVNWKFLGDPNNRITLTGHVGAVPSYSVTQFCESTSVGGGWYGHTWAIEYTDFVRLSAIDFVSNYPAQDASYIWRSSFYQCGFIVSPRQGGTSRSGRISNRFIDGHSATGEIIREGGYITTLTDINYAYRPIANNLFQSLGNGGHLVKYNYGANYNVDNINVGALSDVASGGYSRARRNIYFSYSPLVSFYTPAGWGATVTYDGIDEDNLKFSYSSNPWIYSWGGSTTDSTIYIRNNYCEEGNILVPGDGGDWFAGDPDVYKYRQGNLLVFTRHDNPLIINNASFARHWVLNETYHSQPESVDGGGVYSFQYNGAYYSVAVTGDDNLQKDCLVSDFAVIAPSTVDTSIRLHPGDDQMDDVRSNHYWGVQGGDAHPYASMGVVPAELPYLNLTSMIDAGSQGNATLGATTFTVTANQGTWTNASGALNYPFYAVFAKGTVQEELVHVASFADPTATLVSGDTMKYTHAPATDINSNYGYGDTKGDPFYSGVTDDGLSRRDMAEFYVALKANDGISVTNITNMTHPPSASKLAIWEAFNVEFTKFLTSDWDVRFGKKNIKDWISAGYTPQQPLVGRGTGSQGPTTSGTSNINGSVLDSAITAGVSTTFVVAVGNAPAWSDPSLNYPITVIFDETGLRRQVVEVASFNAGTRTATLAAGTTTFYGEIAGVSINSYGNYKGAVDPGLICWSNTHSLILDGTDDHVTTPDHASLDFTSCTLMCFVKIATADAALSGSLYRKQGAYELLIENGKASFSIDTVTPASDSQTSSIVIADGKWHHIAYTYATGTPGTSRLYIDGKVDVTSTAVGGNLFNSATALELGQVAPSGVPMNVAQVSAWNIAMTKEEVFEIVRPVEDTMCALYRFNSNANDATGNANTGTAGAGITYTAGVKGDSAALFTGLGEISLVNGGGGGTALADGSAVNGGLSWAGLTMDTMLWTLCAFITPDADTEQYILDLGGDAGGVREVGLKIDADNKFRGFYHDGTSGTEKFCVSNATVNIGQTYHVAFVSRGYECTLYIDGVEQDSRIMSQFDTIQNNATPLYYIGAPTNGVANRFEGKIELLEIHNMYLTPWEIKRKSLNKIIPIDLSTTSAFETNCQQFFPLNDNPRILAAASVTDRTPAGNNGVPTNMTGTPQSTDAPGWFDNT